MVSRFNSKRNKTVNEIQNVENILSAFTDNERAALEKYFQSILVKQGRSTASKAIGIMGDIHCGSDLAVAPQDKILYEHQQNLLDWWDHCTDVFNSHHLHKLIVNGEPIDGLNKKEFGDDVNTKLHEQFEGAADLISRIKYDGLRMTSGSGYHVREGGAFFEEMFARYLPKVEKSRYIFQEEARLLTPQQQHIVQQKQSGRQMLQLEDIKKNGLYAPLFFNLNVNGKLFNVSHHIAFSRWWAYRTTALAREMLEMEPLRGKLYPGDRNIDILVRSHVHYFVEVGFINTYGFTTPAWKFPGKFEFRRGLGGTYPTIGAILIIVEQNGDWSRKKLVAPQSELPTPTVEE